MARGDFCGPKIMAHLTRDLNMKKVDFLRIDDRMIWDMEKDVLRGVDSFQVNMATKMSCCFA